MRIPGRTLRPLAVFTILIPCLLGPLLFSCAPRATGQAANPPRTLAPSGIAAPQGDLMGWRQVFVEDFAADVGLGGWPGPYTERWTTYPNGWPDSAGKGGKRSEYRPSRVLSVQGGLLDYWAHTERGKTLGAVIVPTDPEGTMLYQLYGRYAVRFRADPVPGFKAAFLLWPQSELWPQDGEIDFPEGNLDATIDAYTHFQGALRGTDQEHLSTDITFAEWHTAVIEWTPEAVTFLLDDQIIGRSTGRLPATPMRWTFQIERCLDGCAAPAEAEGHVQIDWLAQYAYEPDLHPGPEPPPPVATIPSPERLTSGCTARVVMRIVDIDEGPWPGCP